MKKFKATFHKTIWFNGGMREFDTARIIEARTIDSARHKAEKMEKCGSSRTWYILTDLREADAECALAARK